MQETRKPTQDTAAGVQTMLAKYEHHKKIFNISSSVHLSIFERYLFGLNEDYYLECSCKLNSIEFDAVRFNVWFKNKSCFLSDLLEIIKVFREFSGNGFKIDVAYLKELIHNTDLSKVKEIIFGVDLREKPEDSRLKLWFIIEDYPEKITEIVNGYPAHKKNMLISLTSKSSRNSLLYGYDFCYSGKIGLKAYPLLFKEDLIGLNNEIISDKSRDILNCARSFHITFKDKTDDKVFHIRPEDPEKLVRSIGNIVLSDVYSLIRTSVSTTFIISLEESEIDEGKISSLNIYY